MYQYTNILLPLHYITLCYKYHEMLAQQTPPIQQSPTEQPQELTKDIK